MLQPSQPWEAVFAFLLCLPVASLSASPLALCPATSPCYCEGDTIHCDHMQLDKPPQFVPMHSSWVTLDATDNFIASLKRGDFRNANVQVLNLSRNEIESIDTGSFSSLSMVHTLDLSYNNLHNLSAGVLAGLERLRYLYVKYNALHQVDPGAFHGPSDLTLLDMTGNSLEAIPRPSLQYIPRLRHLLLRDNQLRTIGSYAFSDLERLEYLDLGLNGPSLVLDSQAFCGLAPRVQPLEDGVLEWQGLFTLLLDHNGLSTVTPCLTALIWTLKYVDLSGNPLHCDCAVYSLIQSRSGVNFPGAQCSTPGRLAGKYLQRLSPLDCPQGNTSRQCEERTCQRRTVGALSESSPAPSPPTLSPNLFAALVMLHLLLAWRHVDPVQPSL